MRKTMTARMLSLCMLFIVLATGSATAQGTPTPTGVVVHGNVYGGGNLADVKGNTAVNICAKDNGSGTYVAVSEGDGVTIKGNVYGGGKGKADEFTCAKAMVGVDGEGLTDNNGGATVRIGNGTIGTVVETTDEQTNETVSTLSGGNVYGGGEIGRVEKNTEVTIGLEPTGEGVTSKPDIKGNVFGAGAGKETHGYSALVRGNSTVNVQGEATVGGSVYGGGEIATVGRYIVINGYPTEPNGGGVCTVTIQDKATIAGNVVGAGKGATPSYSSESKHAIPGTALVPFDSKSAYLIFLETLALVSETQVTIGGATAGKTATVSGNVYGGSESGFLQRHAQVTILDNCTIGSASAGGNVYGGGKGYDGFADAGRVSGYTNVTVSGGTTHGSVFGGGELGYVKGGVKVTMTGGTVNHDVYGGGALADTNIGNGTEYVAVPGLTVNESSVSGLYEIKYVSAGSGVAEDGQTYYELKNGVYVVKSGLTVNESSVSGLYVIEYKASTETTAALGKTYYEVFVKDNTQHDGVYVVKNGLTAGDPISGLYEITYQETSDATAVANKSYYTITHPTNVDLLGGTIGRDAYGGGLGQLYKAPIGNEGADGYVAAVSAVEAKVYGDVKLNLNGVSVDEYNSNSTFFSSYLSPVDLVANVNPAIDYYMVQTKGCIVNRVFGCNNLNGTPKSNVTVHVYATQNKDASKATVGDKFNKADYSAYTISNYSGLVLLAERLGIDIEAYNTTLTDGSASEDAKKTALSNIVTAIEAVVSNKRYDLKAVYGGGNEAAYIPLAAYHPDNEPTGSKNQVIIEGCYYTSIETVYGGGNAAPVPEANVTIHSDYEIETVFGGGNGKDAKESDGSDNEGADIGTLDHGTTTYGTGNANTMITGGYIHEAYGGSNERGTIMGTVNLKSEADEICPMVIGKMVTAGKNADIMGDAITVLGCMPDSWVDEYYGGADNANVHGNVELTITSGNFRKVFGGNNKSGIIMGHIKVNIEETGCRPINIDELYLGGNEAAYSYYGYYVVPQTDSEGNIITDEGGNPKPLLTNGKLTFKPRESATDTHKAVKKMFRGTTYNEYSGAEGDTFSHYDKQPELNIISCTHIGEVFGGGLGAPAIMYADPTVNINMEPGALARLIDRDGTTGADNNGNALGEIVDVFGGGNEAAVYGNTTVNIGTATKVQMTSAKDGDGNLLETQPEHDVTGAYITGNVYGGGNQADVTGNTFVNICAKKTGDTYTFVAFTPTDVKITGNVFGGGKGVADNFKCEKAMVGIDGDGIDNPVGGTTINIGNGTVNGSVYGGGEKGRVEKNAVVNIGFGDGEASGTPTSSAPVIMGNVFGAGAGVSTHGYAALLRGNTWVTVAGNAKVEHSVYGGGEIASVGRYTVAQTQDEATANGVDIGEPYSLVSTNSGNCHVTVGGYAEIGPDDMQMKAAGGPDDTGYVFGAGKGVLPYEGYDDYDYDGTNDNAEKAPWRKTPGDDMASNDDDVTEIYTADKEDNYIKYIGTLALATTTEVTIGDHAFIKGSVYGGSENGRVQHNTDVKIQDYCQIGNGWDKTKNSGEGGGVNARYDEADFIDPSTATPAEIEAKAAILHECASWDYGVLEDGKMVYHPYDKYEARDGASTTATDGHTFYGNVFGGGSGLYPYRSRKENVGYEWIRTAGQVGGNTNVTITGGHILTSVYGGNELTDVGNGLTAETGKGKCTVKMSGGTLGVPRTLDQIAAHPVTCYLFGAGKGDQRIHFNQWTNVGSVEVEVSGGIIYGSVFGGGEDGHVLGDVKVTIKDTSTTTGEGEDAVTTTTSPVIGTWGTSYVDGNIFGGGRGFGGDALTAGVVCGNVEVDIQGGKMLGSVYGGGRLASVGTHLVPEDKTARYGKLIPDGKQQTINEVTIGNGDADVSDASGVTHGYVTINISGGTIGNDLEYKYFAKGTTIDKDANHIPQTTFDADNRLTHTRGGNVFAGPMGRLTGLDGSSILAHWADLGKARHTSLTISGTAHIKSNVYGGAELGTVTEGTEINITGGTIGTEITEAVTTGEGEGATTTYPVRYTFGSVYGGGYGSGDASETTYNSIDCGSTTIRDHAGLVYGSSTVTVGSGDDAQDIATTTHVALSGTGIVKGSIFGGGELAQVGLAETGKYGSTDVRVSGGFVGHNQVGFGGATMGNVYGGGMGSISYAKAGLITGNASVTVSGGSIYHNIYGGGADGSVGSFSDYTFTAGGTTTCATGTGKATVEIKGGSIGINGQDNGMVFGSSRGDVADPDASGADPNNKLAWVNNTEVTIGTSGASSNDTPAIKGSVYGSGENGHVLTNTSVAIHSGTIGIETGSPINGLSGANYGSRGNVYGGGCGTDTYSVTETTTDSETNVATSTTKKYFNRTAGIVRGNTTVTMDGGHVVRNIYGGGAMGSVGTFTRGGGDAYGDHVPASITACAEETGLSTVTITGGKVGPATLTMPTNAGMVFGAGRGEVHDLDVYPNLERVIFVNKTEVSISGTAFVKGSVYGGSESGHVLSDTHVVIDGDCQIGCGYDKTFNNGEGNEPGKDLDRVYTTAEWAYDVTSDNTKFLYECNSWPFKAPYTPYDKFADEDGNYPSDSAHPDADNAHPVGTDGHTFYGNVFGGGSGYEPYAPGQWLPTAGMVEGNTTVEIKGGHILTSIYGGCEMSDVGAGGVRKMTVIGGDISTETPDMFYDITKPGGKSTVKMSGGTLGVPRTLAQIAAHPVTCYLFGAGKGDQRIFFNKTTNVKDVEVEISGGRIYGSVFGGGEDGHVMRDVKMTIKDNAYIGTWGTSYVEGNVFGGGRGFSGEALTAGNVGGSVNIDIQGGRMLGSIYGGGRLGSVGYGLYLTDETITIDGESDTPYGTMRPDGYDDRGNVVSDFKRGYITVNISGGTIGNDIEYKYNPADGDKLKMPTTQFDYQNRLTYTRGGNVFAGCMGRLYSLDNNLLPLWPELGRCKQTVLNITGGTIKSNVYGGAELGVVQLNTTVNITGGTVGTKITDPENATNYYYYGSAFGSGKGSTDAITYPEGTAEGDKVDISEAGTVHGNVKVNLNGMGIADYDADIHGAATGDGARLEANSGNTAYVLKSTAKGGIVNKIFGCNDMNGSPKGTVTVHVYATQKKEDAASISAKAAKAATADAGTYDVEAVYGGGNLAAYNPDEAANKAATVIIDGCDLTSINTVYGGGNAASVPATNVTVNGTYEIGRVFGGGNGMDKLSDGSDNPGANVGYYAYPNAANAAYDTKENRIANYGYGSGKAHATIYGGTVHEVYGGSNTKGNIRVEARTTLEDADGNDCEFVVGEAYGGGRNAPMDGDAVLEIGCISGLGKAYGGAANADVNGNVVLNITNGTYDQVFGGNDLGGDIRGSITVNIEETGCHPVIIGELYAGGNRAAYSVWGYDADGKPLKQGDTGANTTPAANPTLNVRSFTSIGTIYGGGYGQPATMVADPYIYIDVVKGKYSANTYEGVTKEIDGDIVTIPNHEANKIGAIQDVFGGGNQAEVIGTPHVMVGTQEYVEIVTVAGNVTGYYTRTGEGTSASPYVYTAATGEAATNTKYYKKVEGVDIRGNVFGGGNNAKVTGNTDVVIGKRKED